MITKNDCYLLLAEYSNAGIDTKEAIDELFKSNSNIPSLNVLKFINDNRQLDVSKFYEKIRKSYNTKKSNLYINIVKEIDNPIDVLTTLSALLTQILLFAKNVDNRQMFLKHVRANEITKVLNIYFSNYDITNCIKVLRLIKADLKALESIKEPKTAKK